MTTIIDLDAIDRLADAALAAPPCECTWPKDTTRHRDVDFYSYHEYRPASVVTILLRADVVKALLLRVRAAESALVALADECGRAVAFMARTGVRVTLLDTLQQHADTIRAAREQGAK